MALTEILQYVGSLGLGALIGVIIKHHLDKSLRNKEMIFNSRKVAYKNVIGRLKNFFLEKDTRGLRDAELAAFVNSFFSEVYLLCSPQLREVIDEYSEKIVLFHTELTQSVLAEKAGTTVDFDNSKSESLHKELSKLSDKAIEMMRKELGVIES